MSQCPDGSELYTGINRPHGNGGPIENTRTDANPILTQVQDLLAQERATLAHAESVANVRTAIDPDTLPSIPTTSGDKAQLRGLSRQLVRQYERAGIGQAQRQADWAEAYNKVSGTTIGETSKWLDFANGVYKRFANQSADFYKWSQLEFATPDRSTLNNPLVQAFESVVPRTRGHLQKYTSMFDTLTKQADPIAQRLHWDTKDLLDAVGHYANAQHAAERNALLLSRWQSELAAEQALGLNGNPETITRLQSDIAYLQNNLDNPTPPADLVSGGYTNGEANALMQQFLKDTGLTSAEADTMAAGLRDIYQNVMQDRIDAGLVSQELLANFPDFQQFVPYMTKYDNTTGAVNNANVYNPGRYYAIEGSTQKPDSAYHTIMHFARRASNEVGMQELGTNLAAALRVAEEQGRNIGLQQHDYARLVQAKHSANEYQRAWANNLENQGGIVVDVPIRDVEGNVSSNRRVFINFDQNWTDPRSGLTGQALNEALTGTVKTATSFNKASFATSLYGQMFTRFNPAFAPVNTFRDLVERSTHIVNRDYYTDTGNVVQGHKLLGRYFTNVPRAGAALRQALNGSIDGSSPMGRLWQEYVTEGLHQQYTRGQNTQRRTLAEIIEARNQPSGFIESRLNQPGFEGLKQRLDQVGAGKDRVFQVIDGWNDYFNNVASFNHYVTLREAGIPTRNAARGTLELLNLYQNGTWTPLLQSLFPFVRPTVQSALAMSRTFGLAPDGRGQFKVGAKGFAGLMGAYAGYLALLPLIKEGMGRDEETGMYRYDQMSLSNLQRFIPIGLGDGNFAKIPTGFGPIQLAITLAVGSDRVQSGLMAPEDLAFETLYVVGKNVSPQNWPEFSFRAQPLDWLAQAFTPTLAKPITDIAFNTNFMGNPITNARNDGFRAKADQGYLSTERPYHTAAQGIYRATGIDLAPEQVKSLVGNLSVGPLRMLKGIIESDELKKSGTTETAAQAMGPWLSAMGGSMFYGRTYETGRAAYYQALNQYRARIRREGIKVTDRSYGSNSDKAEAYWRKQLRSAGWSAADIDDFVTLQLTEKAIRSLDTKFSQDVRPVWATGEDSAPLRREFERLANEKAGLYNGAVNRLNYFAGGR